MKLDKQLESEVRQVIDAYWDNYLIGNIEKMTSLLDDDYTQVGSAESEVFFSKQDAAQFLYDTIDQITGKVELRNRITTIDPVGDSILVGDLCDLYVLNADEWIFYAKFRASSLLQKKEGNWKIVHQHSSFPDPRTEEGGNLAVEKLAAENLLLERQVAERTAALEAAKHEVEVALVDLKATQSQLIQQEKMASLGQLTAGIAHEIKNPLNFVNNFAELNEELVEELYADLSAYPEALADVEDLILNLKRNAQVIHQHGKRADGIVRSMMQHASGGTGQREWIDVNQLASEYIDLAYHGKRAQVPSFMVDIEQDLGDDTGEVEIVAQEIGRVLLNLLGNAFDAVHEHATHVNEGYVPKVTVSTRRNAGGVEIRVADNGPGIPTEIKKKVFEAFFTTKPTGSGTGLGLSLSYDIVTQGHGGTLTVESEEGQGATFIVALPVTKAETTSTS